MAAPKISTAGKPGRCAALEQFLADGMTYMFGNPGTSEEGFLDALQDYAGLRYILTLQESVAVLIGDGYARAARKPALVQIHSSPGLGNAIGALYQAKRGHAPLVVIGGDSGVQYQAMDAQMAGDLVAMAEPVTKWSTMVLERSSLLRVLRRAVKVASTPPMGPVYVCLPLDILDQDAVEEVCATSALSTRVAPDPETVRQIAVMIAAARKPIFFVGDGIAFSGAQEELERLAELAGAEVYEGDSGEVNMSYAHPLYRGMTGHMFGYKSQPITRKGDFNLVCGTYMLPEVFPLLGNIFADGAKVAHIDLDASAIAKNHPVDLGVAADPKLTLRAVAEALEPMLGEAKREEAGRRTAESAKEKLAERSAALAEDRNQYDRIPLHMARFAEELAKQLPEDAIVWDEALTNSPPLVRYRPPRKTGDYFLTRGGSLGVGIPGAIGAKLANPARTVIGLSGDGGSMYTIQALWSAARHNVNAKFVICNNSSYRLLQLNINAYWRERGYAPHEYPLSFDLSHPPIHFDEMARSMGVAGVRVEKPWEIAPAIRQMLEHPGPFLIDLVLESDTHPELIGVKCGQ